MTTVCVLIGMTLHCKPVLLVRPPCVGRACYSRLAPCTEGKNPALPKCGSQP